MSALHSDFSAEISTPTKFCISGGLGCTPTNFMVLPVNPGDRGCTPVILGRTHVKYWTLAGAMGKGVFLIFSLVETINTYHFRLSSVRVGLCAYDLLVLATYHS